MRIAAFSDTHGWHRKVKVPDADVLLFAGDLMTDGYSGWEVSDFANWFQSQPHKHKIFIAGNHDRMAETHKDEFLSYFDRSIVYLENSSCIVNGFKFWGSPYTPRFFDWAFNVDRGERIKRYWDEIPTDTDILVTHGPMYGMLDQASRGAGFQHVGCEELANSISRVQPLIHVFGHIHGGYGEMLYKYWNGKPFTRCYNASICNEAYRPVNSVHVIDILGNR